MMSRDCDCDSASGTAPRLHAFLGNGPAKAQASDHGIKSWVVSLRYPYRSSPLSRCVPRRYVGRAIDGEPTPLVLNRLTVSLMPTGFGCAGRASRIGTRPSSVKQIPMKANVTAAAPITTITNWNSRPHQRSEAECAERPCARSTKDVSAAVSPSDRCQDRIDQRNAGLACVAGLAPAGTRRSFRLHLGRCRIADIDGGRVVPGQPGAQP